MFKLGAITDEISQDLEKAVQVGKEFALQTIEIRSVWDKRPQQLSDTDVAAVKAIAEASGVTVSAIASPFFKCDLDDDAAVSHHMEDLKRVAWVGKQLGTNIIRGFTFWIKPDTEQAWPRILQRFEPVVDICEEEDIVLAIENEPATSVANAKLLERFLTEVDHPRVRAVWDPGNEVCAPTGEKPFPDGYERIKQWMVHFHLKDAVRDADPPGGHCVAVGEGEIDYAGQLKALLASDYQGAVSLETHWRPKGDELTQEQLDRPGGAAFSQTGEYASRICLENLVKIVRQIT
jgi:sugar phosphate isomerase/epimerase